MLRAYAFRLTAAVSLLALITAGCGSDTATVRLETVTPAAAAAELDTDGVVVLDVRTPDEYGQGHLAGAVNIDFYAGDFASQISRLDRDAPYLLYCRSGNRSGATLDLMEELGFTNVVEVGGGILAWASAGLPIE